MWNKLRGFSLLEVLVAVSLLALVLTAVFQGFVNFSRNSDKTKEIFFLQRDLISLKKLIEDDFNNIIFLESFTKDFPGNSPQFISGIQGDNKLIGPHNTDQIFMHLQRDSLSFNEISFLEDPKLHEVGYFVALNSEKEGIYQLYRSEQYYIDNKFNSYVGTISKANIRDELNKKNSLVTDNLVEFNIRYLTHNFLWVDTWNSMSSQNKQDIFRNRGRIPQAIEVELVLKKKNVVLSNKFQVNLRPKLGKDIYWGNF